MEVANKEGKHSRPVVEATGQDSGDCSCLGMVTTTHHSAAFDPADLLRYNLPVLFSGA
jgi:hypothetical protein